MPILKRLKTRTILVNSDAIWNCNESLENKEAKFCILMLFETKFWNYRETLESNDAKWCILTLFKPMSVRIHQDTFHAMDRTNRQWKVRVANISCAIILHQSAFVFTADLEFSDFRFLNMKIRTGVRAYIQLCACHWTTTWFLTPDINGSVKI